MTPRPSLRIVYRRVERRSCVARQGSRILRPVLLGGWTVEGEYCPSARGQARRHWATLSSLVAGPAPRSSESQVESTPGQRYVGAGEAWPRRSGCTHRALPRRLRAQQAEEGAPYLQEPRPCRAASSKALLVEQNFYHLEEAELSQEIADFYDRTVALLEAHGVETWSELPPHIREQVDREAEELDARREARPPHPAVVRGNKNKSG
jgi:hypothetical protein